LLGWLLFTELLVLLLERFTAGALFLLLLVERWTVLLLLLG
jgi:hypothetical protein